MRWLLVTASLVVAGAAQAHDWYTGLRGPDGVVCCGDYDCKPRQSEWRGSQPYLWIEELDLWFPAPHAGDAYTYEGERRTAPPKRRVFSPDGEWHACVRAGKVVCVVAPGMGA